MTNTDNKNEKKRVSRDATAIRTQAASWFEAMNRGDLSPQQSAALQDWLQADPAHARAFHDLEQTWRDLPLLDDVEGWIGHAAAKPDGEPALAGMDSRRRPGWRRPAVWMPALAACLVLAVATLTFTLSQPVQQPSGPVEYATMTAETRTVELEDATLVYLSAESIIAVEYTPGSRNVRLKQGVAWFDVKRNPDRPFIVTAANTQVTVVGTEFEIWRGPDAVRVSVNEGRVEVAPPPSVTTGVTRPTILTAGDQVSSTLAGEIGETGRFDPEETLSWREGRFIYTDKPLGTIITDINRYRQSKITLSDTDLAGLRVTAAFNVDDTEGFLEGFAEAEGFNLRTLRNQTVLSRY